MSGLVITPKVARTQNRGMYLPISHLMQIDESTQIAADGLRYPIAEVGSIPEPGTLTSGLIAARPAASVVTDGTEYFATDVAGGSLYRAVGDAWYVVGGKAELAAVSDATTVTHVQGAPSVTAIPGCTWTGWCDGSALHVEASAYVKHSAASALVGLVLQLDGVGIVSRFTQTLPTAGQRTLFRPILRVPPPSIASHTLSLHLQTFTAGTGTADGTVTPTEMFVTRV